MSVYLHLLTLLFAFPLFAQTDGAEDEIIDIRVDSETDLADRNRAEQLNNQGNDLLASEQYAAAEPLLRQAIELDSTSVIYYENLARSLGGQQDYEAVALVYAQAQEQFPDNSDLFYYQGDALQKLKQYKEARVAYGQAIAVSKQYPGTQLLHLYYFNRGNTHLKERNYEAARQDYDRALKINDFHYASFANRGFARYNLKDKEGACADWRQAKEAGYEMAQTYLSKYCL